MSMEPSEIHCSTHMSWAETCQRGEYMQKQYPVNTEYIESQLFDIMVPMISIAAELKELKMFNTLWKTVSRSPNYERQK